MTQCKEAITFSNENQKNSTLYCVLEKGHIDVHIWKGLT